MKEKVWCVYMLERTNGRIYTGYTGNLAERFKFHMKNKSGCKLFYVEICTTQHRAILREIEIKEMSRKKKMELAGVKLLPSL